MQRIVNGRACDTCALRTFAPRRPRRRERELYCGLCGREQELQEGAHALSPGGFVVLRAVDNFKVQVAAILPAALEQRIAQRGDVRDGVRVFLGADVEPDARSRDQRRLRRKINY